MWPPSENSGSQELLGKAGLIAMGGLFYLFIFIFICVSVCLCARHRLAGAGGGQKRALEHQGPCEGWEDKDRRQEPEAGA